LVATEQHQAKIAPVTSKSPTSIGKSEPFSKGVNGAKFGQIQTFVHHGPDVTFAMTRRKELF